MLKNFVVRILQNARAFKIQALINSHVFFSAALHKPFARSFLNLQRLIKRYYE